MTRQLLFALVFLNVTTSLLAQESEVHQSDEVFSKKPLTESNIAVIDALITRNTVSEKIKGDSEKGSKKKVTGWSGKTILNYNSQKKGDKLVEHFNYKTVGLKLTRVDGKITHQHYRGFIPIDTTRKLEIATFDVVDDTSDTYVFTKDISFDKAFQKVELFIRYEGDDMWVPVGKHGKNLKSLLAFEPIPLRRFQKYEHRNRWGGRIILIGGALVVPGIFLVGYIPPIAVLGACGIVGIPLADRSEKHILTAIELHNSFFDQ